MFEKEIARYTAKGRKIATIRRDKVQKLLRSEHCDHVVCDYHYTDDYAWDNANGFGRGEVDPEYVANQIGHGTDCYISVENPYVVSIIIHSNLSYTLYLKTENSTDQVEPEQTTTETEQVTEQVTVRYNADKNGIEVAFAEKPAQGTIELLKGNGFKWSRRGFWYAKDTAEHRRFIEGLTAILEDIANTTETYDDAEPVEADTVQINIVQHGHRDTVTVNKSDVYTVGEYGAHADGEKLADVVKSLYPDGDIGYSFAQGDYDYLPPTHTAEYAEGQRVPMHCIMVRWSECGLVRGGEMFSTWTDANQFIMRIARDHDANGGYYKTSFVVCWENGYVYQGRLDVNMKDDNDISEHIRQHCEFHAGTWTPSHMTKEDHEQYLNNFNIDRDEFSEFLDTYELCDHVPPMDPRPRKGANVIDFATALQQRHNEQQRTTAIDYFTNEILPNMPQEDLRRIIETGDIQTELLRAMVKVKVNKLLKS